MKRMQIVTVLSTAAIAMVGSHAYTAGFISGIPPATYIASSSTTVTGATADSVNYSYDATNTQVTGISVVIHEDTHLQALVVTPYIGATAGTSVTCTTVSTGAPTTYTCTVSWPMSTLTKIDFAITA